MATSFLLPPAKPPCDTELLGTGLGWKGFALGWSSGFCLVRPKTGSGFVIFVAGGVPETDVERFGNSTRRIVGGNI